MAVFYCQLDYEHVPYLSPVGVANGNLANNGCGVCTACMIVENMTDMKLPPEEGAKMAKACGAREGFGTDLFIFAPVAAKYAGLRVSTEWDCARVWAFLREGRGMVIANVQGDRKEDGYIGVFSDSGHYIVLAGAEDNAVKVWDPMYREGSGRYDIPGRKGKVRLEGTDAFADISVIREDCKDRPFFLFEKIDSEG